MDVVRRRLLADEQHLLARCVHATACSEVKTTWPEAAPGDGRQALGDDRQLLPLRRIEHRREQLRQRFGLDQQQRFPRRRCSFSSTMSVAITTAA